jgi:hypothetical protein
VIVASRGIKASGGPMKGRNGLLFIHVKLELREAQFTKNAENKSKREEKTTEEKMLEK